MSVLPVAHVDDVDRYVVSRVDSLPGFYGVAQYRGFRDEPSLDVDEIVTKINEVEIRLGRDGAALVASQLRDHSLRPTHVYVSRQSRSQSRALSVTCSVPHYEVKSRGLNMGRITPIMNYLRRALIEEVYGRLSKALRLHARVFWALTYVAKPLCSLIRRAGGPAPMSRSTTFCHRYMSLI